MLEVLLIVALLVLAAWSLHRWWFSGDRGWMPLELRRATLAYAEHLFQLYSWPMFNSGFVNVFNIIIVTKTGSKVGR